MFHYQINFSNYKLKSYEKDLALKEFEGQFPSVKEKNVTDGWISFTTNKLLSEHKLKKLTFYSDFNYRNGHVRTANILTDQTVIENCHKGQPNLLGNIVPKRARDIRYLTHSAHEYKGRFYPQIAKSLLNYAGVKAGDTVLDPFCGSGTTLVESFLFGINAIGVDINPIAYLITKAKVKSLTLQQKDLMVVRKLFANLAGNADWEGVELEKHSNNLDIEYLMSWFPVCNLKKIIFIQNRIATLPTEPLKLFSRVVLSNILKDFSFQEPSQLRTRRRVDVPPNNLADVFEKNLNDQVERLEKFQELNRLDINAHVNNYLGDVRNLLKSANLGKNSIDVVITSPPYATALPYVDTDRLSLFAFGYTDKSSFKELEKSLIGNREITKVNRIALDAELQKNFKSSILPDEVVAVLQKIFFLNVKSDVGFRRKNTAAVFYKYFMDMYRGIGEVSRVLKRGKLAFFVVGNNRTTAGNENIKVPTDDFVRLIAEKHDFQLVEKIPMSVQKSYMIHSKNSINTESILVLRRK